MGVDLDLGYKSHYQFEVFVCVSVISGRVQIIARMRSISVFILAPLDANEAVEKVCMGFRVACTDYSYGALIFRK